MRPVLPRRFPWAAPTWPAGVPRPRARRRLGVDYDTDWTRAYPARLVRAVVVDAGLRPLAHGLAAPQVRGDEQLASLEPPVLFVANHASHVDTPLLVSLLPRPFRHKTVVAAAADTFFDRRWKAHLWALALGAIPIERHRVNRRSAEVAAGLIDDGWNLVIFPEGGRSPDGYLRPFRGGAAYLALRTGRPVVPVHLDGTFRMLPKDGGRLRPARTRVLFGPPLRPEPGEDARRFNARVEAAVTALADEQGSDWWSARRRAAAGTTPSAHGPAASPWRRAWARPRPEGDGAGRWALGE